MTLLASRMVDSVAGESPGGYTRIDADSISSHGFVVGHVVPEAQVGGPIALVQDGDVIHIDAVANTISVEVSDEEMAQRKAKWVAPPLKVSQGTLLKYARLVSDASQGCGESSIVSIIVVSELIEVC